MSPRTKIPYPFKSKRQRCDSCGRRRAIASIAFGGWHRQDGSQVPAIVPPARECRECSGTPARVSSQRATGDRREVIENTA